MADTSSSSSSPEGIAVIGGEGFLGHAIVVALSSKYRAPSHRIVSLDVVQRHYPSKDQWTFQVCDLTSSSSLVDAFKAFSIKTVFHTASPWIGAGKEVCEKVNVEGTEKVIEACKSQGVKKLVYTSSASVVHDGGDLINIDERCTIPKDQKDQYNITKARADALVLAANDKDGLLTCCLRPAGIFGPGDRQNIPGYINAYKQGKHKIMMGSGENLWDWTYIDNVVHAHLLAASKLGESVHYTVFSDRTRPVAASIPRRVIPTSKNVPSTSGDQVVVQDDSIDPPLPATRNRLDQWFDLQYVPEEDKEIAYLPIAGEAYFITNGEQVPFWNWARKIWYEYAGHSKKMFGLPVDIGLAYATIENALCSLMGKESAIPKNRISLSVCKRYYNIEKARKMLGYEPVIGLDEGLKIAVKWYKDNEKDLEPLKQESKK